MRFIVLGNDLPCNAIGFGWLGSATGHVPAQAERLVPPSGVGVGRPGRPPRQAKHPLDETLDERTAIEFARIEQERAPADLLGTALTG